MYSETSLLLLHEQIQGSLIQAHSCVVITSGKSHSHVHMYCDTLIRGFLFTLQQIIMCEKNNETQKQHHLSYLRGGSTSSSQISRFFYFWHIANAQLVDIKLFCNIPIPYKLFSCLLNVMMFIERKVLNTKAFLQYSNCLQSFLFIDRKVFNTKIVL